MKRFRKLAALTLVALSSLTLTHCSGAADDDGSGNVYIPLSDFDTLEIIRESPPTSTSNGPAYYMDIDLKEGTATGTYRTGSTLNLFDCTPDDVTRLQIINMARQIQMIVQGDSNCPSTFQSNYEVAKSSSKMITIDGCKYEYVDDGYQKVVQIINELEPYCTPNVNLPTSRFRPRLVP